MKSYYFISGLPRSGSTLLSAILRQNPDFYADIASKLPAIVSKTIDSFSRSLQEGVIDEMQRKNIVNAVFKGYYQHIDKPVIFDSGREWTSKTHLLKHLFPYTKILCCVRDVVSILNSFEVAFSKNPLYKNKLLDHNDNVYYRCVDLMEEGKGIVYTPFLHLKEGYAANPHMILLIKYENLCKDPEKTMKEVYEFLEKPYYPHNFEDVEYSNEIFDSACNIMNFHTVKRKVEYNPPKCILPLEVVERYKQMNMEFWEKDRLSSNYK